MAIVFNSSPWSTPRSSYSTCSSSDSTCPPSPMLHPRDHTTHPLSPRSHSINCSISSNSDSLNGNTSSTSSLSEAISKSVFGGEKEPLRQLSEKGIYRKANEVRWNLLDRDESDISQLPPGVQAEPTANVIINLVSTFLKSKNKSNSEEPKNETGSEAGISIVMNPVANAKQRMAKQMDVFCEKWLADLLKRDLYPDKVGLSIREKGATLALEKEISTKTASDVIWRQNYFSQETLIRYFKNLPNELAGFMQSMTLENPKFVERMHQIEAEQRACHLLLNYFAWRLAEKDQNGNSKLKQGYHLVISCIGESTCNWGLQWMPKESRHEALDICGFEIILQMIHHFFDRGFISYIKAEKTEASYDDASIDQLLETMLRSTVFRSRAENEEKIHLSILHYCFKSLELPVLKNSINYANFLKAHLPTLAKAIKIIRDKQLDEVEAILQKLSLVLEHNQMISKSKKKQSEKSSYSAPSSPLLKTTKQAKEIGSKPELKIAFPLPKRHDSAPSSPISRGARRVYNSQERNLIEQKFKTKPLWRKNLGINLGLFDETDAAKELADPEMVRLLDQTFDDPVSVQGHNGLCNVVLSYYFQKLESIVNAYHEKINAFMDMKHPQRMADYKAYIVDFFKQNQNGLGYFKETFPAAIKKTIERALMYAASKNYSIKQETPESVWISEIQENLRRCFPKNKEGIVIIDFSLLNETFTKLSNHIMEDPVREICYHHMPSFFDHLLTSKFEDYKSNELKKMEEGQLSSKEIPQLMAELKNSGLFSEDRLDEFQNLRERLLEDRKNILNKKTIIQAYHQSNDVLVKLSSDYKINYEEIEKIDEYLPQKAFLNNVSPLERNTFRNMFIKNYETVFVSPSEERIVTLDYYLEKIDEYFSSACHIMEECLNECKLSARIDSCEQKIRINKEIKDSTTKEIESVTKKLKHAKTDELKAKLLDISKKIAIQEKEFNELQMEASSLRTRKNWAEKRLKLTEDNLICCLEFIKDSYTRVQSQLDCMRKENADIIRKLSENKEFPRNVIIKRKDENKLKKKN